MRGRGHEQTPYLARTYSPLDRRTYPSYPAEMTSREAADQLSRITSELRGLLGPLIDIADEHDKDESLRIEHTRDQVLAAATALAKAARKLRQR